MILYALYGAAIFFPCHPTYGVLPYSMIHMYIDSFPGFTAQFKMYNPIILPFREFTCNIGLMVESWETDYVIGCIDKPWWMEHILLIHFLLND